MLLLRRLQRDEDGQALVLGAIFALVLMLCALSMSEAFSLTLKTGLTTSPARRPQP